MSACNARDLGSIPGWGRSPGEGNGNPLQYSCPENPVDRGAWCVTVHGVAKSRTRLSDKTHNQFFIFSTDGRILYNRCYSLALCFVFLTYFGAFSWLVCVGACHFSGCNKFHCINDPSIPPILSMKSYALERFDVITQSHTVGLHLEPGFSGPQLVFFS